MSSEFCVSGRKRKDFPPQLATHDSLFVTATDDSPFLEQPQDNIETMHPQVDLQLIVQGEIC